MSDPATLRERGPGDPARPNWSAGCSLGLGMCNSAAVTAVVVVLGAGHAAWAEGPPNNILTAVVGLGTRLAA